MQDENAESPPVRKDYALRKRGAAAGEQILEQANHAAHEAEGAKTGSTSPFVPCKEADLGEGFEVDMGEGKGANAVPPPLGEGSRSRRFVVRVAGCVQTSPQSASSGAGKAFPCTPMLKTPELEEVAADGALGMSPLSEFASLLDMTPRLPEQVGSLLL